MSIVGANYEELEAGAARLKQAADELDAHAKGIQGTIGGLSWFGQVATAFLNMWNGGHRRQLASTAVFIRRAADELAKQATQQRSASEGIGSGWSMTPSPTMTDLDSVVLPGGAQPPGWWTRSPLPESTWTTSRSDTAMERL